MRQRLLEARDAETIEQVALLWKETQAYYADWLKWWEGSRSIWFTDDEVFVYLDKLIKSLERASVRVSRVISDKEIEAWLRLYDRGLL
jgi:hypothetical protein